jgi:hypothetical protein
VTYNPFGNTSDYEVKSDAHNQFGNTSRNNNGVKSESANLIGHTSIAQLTIDNEISYLEQVRELVKSMCSQIIAKITQRPKTFTGLPTYHLSNTRITC